MTDLSPATQAIVNAAVEAGGKHGHATLVLQARLAAAFRAAAEHVEWSTLDWPADVQLGIIAEELENL
jgi:hypothetical protein